MIPSTFFQELFMGNIQGGFPSGKENVKQGGQARSGFSTLLSRLMNDSRKADTAALGKELPRGHQFLEQLKKAIMASGVSLEAGRVDSDTMSQFQNLLVKAGFKRQEVQEMISDLTSADTGKGVTLATLFGKASQLSKTEEERGTPVHFEISTLPFIETILGRLGMDRESVRSVLADAKMERSGIDLGKLAANIRRAMAADRSLSDTISGNPDDVLDMMRRIGLLENEAQPVTAILDKMISELSRINKKSAALEGTGKAAEEVSRDLIVPFLQQLAEPLGDKGKKLQQLIGSIGKEDTGFDGESLMKELVRIRQEISATSAPPRMTNMSGIQGETRNRGEMSLSRFVAALEARVSAEQQLKGVLEGGDSGQTAAQAVGKFLEKITADSSVTRSNVAIPTVVEHGPLKQRLAPDARQAAEKPITGANGKDGQGQSLLEANRQVFSGGDTGRNSTENPSGKDETAKFMEALTSSGKDKVKKSSEQNLSAADSVIRAAKSADEFSASIKMPANRTLPGYLLDQVSRQIVKLRIAGENEITLQLKPPHLGRMKLNVEHTAGGIKVGIVVESAAAKEMLLANANELKAALGDQGLRLEKIDIETQSNFERNMAQANREFGQSGSQNSRRSWRDPIGSSLSPEGAASSGMIREVEAGRLDLVA